MPNPDDHLGRDHDSLPADKRRHEPANPATDVADNATGLFAPCLWMYLINSLRQSWVGSHQARGDTARCASGHGRLICHAVQAQALAIPSLSIAVILPSARVLFVTPVGMLSLLPSRFAPAG
ncbi:MAG: hypothetical protein J2P31_05145, partial [Blastocatellia bacterium]|nr:hypothetical protein [Blastocatellia bacterium]